ncbi:MAG: helicase [Chloroflexi bacterium]|nr:helicase [Chloroflexota bacterium]
MQSIGDIIQAIARQRGRGEHGPLLMLRSLDAVAGERVSHLPIDPQLAQAWLAYSGEPFRPHQAQALAALRRGDPVALQASSADVAATVELLTRAILAEDHDTAALLIVANESDGQALQAAFDTANQALPRQLHMSTTSVGAPRVDPFARLVITTPESLHARLLRHHERGWSRLWNALRLIAIPDAHRYAGIAGAHLDDLLLRVQRVATAHGAIPAFLATILELADPAPALAVLLGHSWRIVRADDGPRPATIVAAWQGGATRLRETIDLVTAMQRQSYRIHVACSVMERAVLMPAIGDLAGVTVGPEARQAQILVCAGFPGSISALKRLLASGYQAVIVVLGEVPHEQALARHVSTLVSGPLSAWPTPPANAYAMAQHVLCAANELPLSTVEIDAWGCAEIVERMAASRQLTALPDNDICWIPAGEGDPYAEFSMLAASGDAIVARSEQPRIHALLDPTLYERWAFTGASLPPGVGGLRVVTRDEESGAISLRLETSSRRTFPLRRGDVTIREVREERSLASERRVAWGRVVVQETIYAYRESAPGAAVADVALRAPLESRWIAPACWFDLPTGLQVLGQFVGWCLAAALPLRVLASFTDVAPFYDHERRRLFFVDAQPGGNGLARWIYQHAEELLPVAYDVALACRVDPLLEPLSRIDQDWLLALLGRTALESSQARDETLLQPSVRDRSPEGAHAEQRGAPVAREERRAQRREERRSRDQGSGTAPAATDRSPAGQESLPFRDVQETPLSGAERQGAPPAYGGTTPANASPPGSTDEDGMPDAAALIARLRRQRAQRDQQTRATPAAPSGAPDVEPRFASGERIFCLPYGDGEIIASRIEGGREILTVRFPDHGDLTIDPAVSLVRKLDAPQADDGDRSG